MKTLKIFLILIMFAATSLLSSCVFPGPGHGSHGGGKVKHEQQKQHENNGHHDKDDHHGK